MATSRIRYIFLFLAFFAVCQGNNANYRESVKVTHLPRHQILTELNSLHSINLPKPGSAILDLAHFPKFIYNLAVKNNMNEARVSFTRGLWDFDSWGRHPDIAPLSGFQLIGWIEEDIENFPDKFDSMIAYLSGYMCGSISTLKVADTIRPSLNIHQPRSSLVSNDILNHRYFILQRSNEPVCTENFRPWMDLLPCRGRAGIGSLLNPEAIYRSEYHSMSLEISVDCTSTDCSAKTLSLNLKMHTVFDLSRWNRNLQWSLKNVFGSNMSTQCKLAPSETNQLNTEVTLLLPKQVEYVSNLFTASEIITKKHNHLEVVYRNEEVLNEIGISSIESDFSDFVNPPFDIHVRRFKSGFNDDNGAIGILIENRGQSDAEVQVIEKIPWRFKLYLHLAEITVNGQSLDGSSGVLQEFHIQPSIDRKQDHMLQSKWLVSGHSRVQIKVPIEREFLRVDEFPADSQRGIDVPGAFVSVKLLETGENYAFATNGVLFTWPLPDGTMPFNVITFTFTVVALFYGAFFNIIFRRYYIKHPNDPPAAPLARVVWKFKQVLLKRIKKEAKHI